MPQTTALNFARSLWGVLQWWPTLLGIGLAAFIALDMTSGTHAGAASWLRPGSCTLAPPPCRSPRRHGRSFIVTFAVITATTVLDQAEAR